MQALKNADGTPCIHAYRLLATMRQGAGRQADAVKLIDKALSFKKDVSALVFPRDVAPFALQLFVGSLVWWAGGASCVFVVD